ncbi:calmodulin-binding protein 60 A-like isoform X1 [Impatiens glandulifera]|uniref:calmodulin-binding protein 60 A-like isoform X1 n=1 Tax=Impatiens glandulifera TaxID=253017 RepID=UPI001FB12756|nr:calmodulin-binding protein 60 A-like isoform X1 [Impatiens glandulifera]
MNGKKILKGNACLQLKEGIGALDDLSILHNKIWKRVTKLRLGARLMDSFQNIRVKEAKTQTFTMKDKRMKADMVKGAVVVSLMDNVWCLKNIGQHRPIVDRLTERGIKTIKDFLSLYFVHSEELMEILGRVWTERKLKATIDHCLKCKKLEKRYLAPHPNDSEENYGVVYTEVFNVLGIFKGSQFIPFDKLSETLKCNARNRVKDAFDNKEEEAVVWDETIYPLVSPTAITCASSNEPFTSYSMMDDDVASGATIGTEAIYPLVSPTAITRASSNEPFSSYSMMDDDVASGATIGTEAIYPLVSPTAITCASSNEPFSSYSMMDDDVASEATIGTDVFSWGEEGEVDRNASVSYGLENGHDPTTGGEIFSSDDHGYAMFENDPNNILLLPIMMNMIGSNWNCVIRIPSFNNEDQLYL